MLLIAVVLISIGIRNGYWLARTVFLLSFAFAILNYADGLSYSNNLLGGLLGLVTNLINTGVAILIIHDLLRRPAVGEAAG
ncbi:hypothetical protein DNI29_21245 [Hymenobacter sediminis]|uniref:hypothetical protein n=1 Tax=Hymenobacter sediminis TaxID=2218621 RepID=UPI000F4FF71A|nr:hypothetical protein [Hymenobacter sediminis]RPD44657.1 hypothetical protein DNI29_21245 [Hymenobacter sediminis]